ncbi:hypothetical protein BH09MYX1_BH09MYX1_33590 [soil metagenome]
MTKLYVHSSRSEWGNAQLISEADGKRTYMFSDGKQRTFPASHWNLMLPATADAREGDPAPSTSGGGDLRALRTHTRLVGDASTMERYASSVAEEPAEGTRGNHGYYLARDAITGFLVGEGARFGEGLARAVELLEQSHAAGERSGETPALTAARNLEILAVAHWLRGDAARATERFRDSAIATTEYFHAEPKERRTAAGMLVLRWMAAGEPQRGLDAINATKVARPRTDGEDVKKGHQDRHYDAFARTMMGLAESVVGSAAVPAIHKKSMKALTTELAKNIARDDYSFVEIPQHVVWMKVFGGDLLKIDDPERVLLGLYSLAPTVKQPAGVASRLEA